MLSPTLEPGLWFLLAFILNVKAFHHPLRYRPYFLLAIWTSLICSLCTLDQLTWPESANYVLGMGTFGLMLLAPFTLLHDQPLLLRQVSTHRSWTLGYKIANNPRVLPITLRRDEGVPAMQRSLRLIRFAGERLIKITFLCFLEICVFDRILSQILRGSTPEDFKFASPLASGGLYIWRQPLQQIACRSLISVYWIWSTYLFVSIAHAILSILFVAIL
ncbi:hypothetical protein E8E14_006498 [Neopestalotiopsis sp. 37M]|nr:hypothetical protein E8E14_006498 [Neopestalotiopsis sp. 37M]